MYEPTPKIKRAIEASLAYVRDARRPLQQVNDALAILRDSPDWTEAEILIVKGFVVAELWKRRSQCEQNP